MYGINTDAQFRDTVYALDLAKPRYVLWDTKVAGAKLTTWFPSYVHPAAHDMLVEHYLLEHYNVVGIKNGFRVLERKHAITNQAASPR